MREGSALSTIFRRCKRQPETFQGLCSAMANEIVTATLTQGIQNAELLKHDGKVK